MWPLAAASLLQRILGDPSASLCGFKSLAAPTYSAFSNGIGTMGSNRVCNVNEKRRISGELIATAPKPLSAFVLVSAQEIAPMKLIRRGDLRRRRSVVAAARHESDTTRSDCAQTSRCRPESPSHD